MMGATKPGALPATTSGMDSARFTMWNRTRRLGIEIDDESGMPCALLAHFPSDREVRFPVRWAATLVTEGEEIERHPFGLAYANTIDLSNFTLASRTIIHDFTGYDELFTVSTTVDGWGVDWEYRFRN